MFRRTKVSTVVNRSLRRATRHRRRVLIETLEIRHLLAANLLNDDAGFDVPQAIVEQPCAPHTSHDDNEGSHFHPVFAPGTPREYVDSFHDLMEPSAAGAETDPTSPFNLNNRWTNTATNGSGLGQGDATMLTWSIAPDGTSIPGFNGEPSAASDLVDFLSDIYGVTTDDTNYTDEPWFALMQSTVDRWGEVSGLTYVYEPSDDGVPFSEFATNAPGILGTRGDIRIGGHFIDGNSGILAYNFYPNNGEMVIDTADPIFYGDTDENSIGLRNVLTHEQGHGIGLRHVESITAQFLMEPFINTNFDGPQYDDILGAQRHYGDVYESDFNDTVVNATDVGTIPNGETVGIGTDAGTTIVDFSATDFVSIDDDSDIDVFQFQILSGGQIDLLLTPVGPTYLQGPQGGLQTPFNAAAQSDLTLELIDTDGLTVLATAAANGLGDIESITGFAVPTGGTYFARIGGDRNAAQTYRLEITAQTLTAPLISGPPSPTMNDPVDLTIDFFSNVTGFDQTDIIISNGSITNFASQGNGRFTVTVDAIADGPVDVSIPAGAATDPDGVATEASLPYVIVVDTTPPFITGPADVSVEASTTGGASINDPAIAAFIASASAIDNIDGSPEITTDSPAIFPVGDTLVTFTATDDAGNTALATATVTVTDTTEPSIELPPDSTLDGDTFGGAMVTNREVAAFLARALGSDIADDSVTVTNDAPAILPLGPTVVTFTATDDSGNEATASAIMTVEDTKAPSLAVPANISLEPDSSAGVASSHPTIVAFLAAATASDIVDESVLITHDGPNQYPIGDTVVIFTATDDSGNATAKAVTVSVTDQSPPSIVVPGNLAMEGDTIGGASIDTPGIIQFLAAASGSDTIDQDVTVTHDAPEWFPVGETVVTFIATDDGGNQTARSSVLTILDTTGPSLSVPAGIEREANVAGGFLASDAVTEWLLANSSVADTVQAEVNITYDAPALLPLGDNLVTITATDGVGNSTRATTTVRIVDTTEPTLVVPRQIVVPADTDQGASDAHPLIAEFLAAAQGDDIVGGATTVTHDAPTVFPLGHTRVTFTTTDAAGNRTSASSTVTVFNSTTVPDRLAVEGDAIHGAAITHPAIAGYLEAVIASKQADSEMIVTHNAPEFFLLGLTAVTFTVTDSSGNVDHDVRRVTVNDFTPPQIVPPNDLSLAADSADGTRASNAAIAAFLAEMVVHDFVDAAPTITVDIPDTLPVGETLVAFTAMDLSGNLSTASATITVNPWAPPTLSDSILADDVNRWDVNRDGRVSALDALNVINELSLRSGQQFSDTTRFDVNHDGQVSASDALMVINRIHLHSGSGEALNGRSAASPPPSAGDNTATTATTATTAADISEPSRIDSSGGQAATFATAEATDRAIRIAPISDASDGRLSESAIDAAIDELAGNLF